MLSNFEVADINCSNTKNCIQYRNGIVREKVTNVEMKE